MHHKPNRRLKTCHVIKFHPDLLNLRHEFPGFSSSFPMDLYLIYKKFFNLFPADKKIETTKMKLQVFCYTIMKFIKQRDVHFIFSSNQF